MPHAALWVVQRGTADVLDVPNVVSMPHAALWVVQLRSTLNGRCADMGFNAARGFVGGAATIAIAYSRAPHGVSMPHAALWVVQPQGCTACFLAIHGFNAARGFVGGAAQKGNPIVYGNIVSMPHAALWVVQLRRSQPLSP